MKDKKIFKYLFNLKKIILKVDYKHFKINLCIYGQFMKVIYLFKINY